MDGSAQARRPRLRCGRHHGAARGGDVPDQRKANPYHRSQFIYAARYSMPLARAALRTTASIFVGNMMWLFAV
jgi:hypothetical protein